MVATSATHEKMVIDLARPVMARQAAFLYLFGRRRSAPRGADLSRIAW
ncbi:MAG TPA: hypothetical protein VKV19_03280 [Ktedonobacteraceae bacterium]|nr:hypothetical protein [Ktedonobacteraceae bacterium]